MRKKLLRISLTLMIVLISFYNMDRKVFDSMDSPHLNIGNRESYMLIFSGDETTINSEEFRNDFFKEMIQNHNYAFYKSVYQELNRDKYLSVSNNFRDYIDNLYIRNNRIFPDSNYIDNNKNNDISLYTPLSKDRFIIQNITGEKIYELDISEIHIIDNSNGELNVEEIINDFLLKYPSVEVTTQPNVGYTPKINYTLKNLPLVIILILITSFPILFELFGENKKLSILKLEGHSELSIISDDILKIIFWFFNSMILIIVSAVLLIPSFNASKILISNSIFYLLIAVLINIIVYILVYLLIYSVSLNALMKGQSFLKRSLDLVIILKMIFVVGSILITVSFVDSTLDLLHGIKSYDVKKELYHNRFYIAVKPTKFDDEFEFSKSKQYQEFRDELFTKNDVFSYKDVSIGFNFEEDVYYDDPCLLVEVSDNYLFGNNIAELNGDKQYYSKNTEISSECYDVLDNNESSEEISIRYIENVPLSINGVSRVSSNSYTGNLTPDSNTIYEVIKRDDIENIMWTTYFYFDGSREEANDYIDNLAGDSYYYTLSLEDELDRDKSVFIINYIFTLFVFTLVVYVHIMLSKQMSLLSIKTNLQEIDVKRIEGHSTIEIASQEIIKNLFWYVSILILIVLLKLNTFMYTLVIVGLLYVSDLLILFNDLRKEDKYGYKS